jgi:tRNA threonylcarbamoyladenosine modification (KEOPS) complex  Pcc1 subunit
VSAKDIKSRSVLEIPLESEQKAMILYSALLPETESIPSDRATSRVAVRGSSLFVEIEASDLTAMRASLNSFVAWISACTRTIERIDARSTDGKP